MLSAPLEDPLGEHRPHTGQRVQLGKIGGVEVDQRGSAATGGRRSASTRARAVGSGEDLHTRRGDVDLLPIDDRAREVDPFEVGRGQRPSGRSDHIDNPGTLRHPHDPWRADLTDNMDDEEPPDGARLCAGYGARPRRTLDTH